MSLLTLITDPQYLQHDTGGDEHPENPARLQVIAKELQQVSFHSGLIYESPRMAEREWLLTTHSESWLFRFEEAVLSGRTYIDHPDNQIGYDSYEIAGLSAGAGLSAIDRIEAGTADNVFCLVRPPGHHAEKKVPYGFCFFNNTVIAARYWQQKYGVKRVLIFDFDAHHGNGIQSAFEEEAGNFYVSIHEHPSFSYPGTGYSDEHGMGEGKGCILNLPLRPGAADNDVCELLSDTILPQLEMWQPDAIIVAAGFDAHQKDDMSGLQYSTELYYILGKEMRQWAERFTRGKLLSILEGGYELSVLGESVAAYCKGLLGK